MIIEAAIWVSHPCFNSRPPSSPSLIPRKPPSPRSDAAKQICGLGLNVLDLQTSEDREVRSLRSTCFGCGVVLAWFFEELGLKKAAAR
ncbi:hypothetical protein NL676_017531 [Syzygium grande]|nr:hypothetical protein NL676_017531 [Syzygium grande]